MPYSGGKRPEELNIMVGDVYQVTSGEAFHLSGPLPLTSTASSLG